MPFGDGTGPAGMGPMTGRGLGYCAGFGAPGYMNPGFGRGWWGRGGGRGGGGRGRHHWYWATGLPGWARAGGWPMAPGYQGSYAQGVGPYGQSADAEQERQMLQAQAQNMQQALEQINKRLSELEAQQAESSK